jgi:hypothetical protein
MNDPLDLKMLLETAGDDAAKRERIRRAYQHIGSGDPDTLQVAFAQVCVSTNQSMWAAAELVQKILVETAVQRKKAALDFIAPPPAASPVFDSKAIGEALTQAIQDSASIQSIQRDADLAARGSGRALALIIFVSCLVGFLLGSFIF